MDLLSSLYAKRTHESFAKHCFGKLQKFVTTSTNHFHYDEACTEVRCKPPRKKKKLKISLLLVPSESRVGSSHDEETSNEPGKLQLLFPSSSLLEKEFAASSSVVDSAAATAFKGILHNVCISFVMHD